MRKGFFLLSLQNGIKFKQDIDMEILEINILCTVDAIVLLSIMGSLSYGLREFSSFLRFRFMYKIR